MAKWGPGVTHTNRVWPRGCNFPITLDNQFLYKALTFSSVASPRSALDWIENFRPAQLISASLLVSGDVETNPGPVRAAPHRFLQLNVNGIQSSAKELSDFLVKQQISVAAIQESKLKKKSKNPVFPGYSSVRKDRPRNDGGGGLLILVEENIDYELLDTSQIEQAPDQNIQWPLELLGIKVKIDGSQINVFNVYIPPVSRDRNYRPTLTPLLSFSSDDSVILGDFNAHNAGWFSELDVQDAEVIARGDNFVDEIGASDYCILNDGDQTRRPSAGSASSPDISLISAHLAAAVNWKVIVDLNSDHLPIVIEFDDDREDEGGERRTYVNLKKAKWPEWTKYVETGIANLKTPTNCSRGVVNFNRVVERANRKFIPMGSRENYKPSFPAEAAQLRERRNNLREANHEDPEISDLNQQISQVISVEGKKAWIDKLQEVDPRHSTNTKPFWGMIKGLSGKSVRRAKNQPISFKGKVKKQPKVIATNFNVQYTTLKPHKSDKETRKVKRKLLKRKLVRDFNPFTEAQVVEGIRNVSNSTALGPDGMSNVHLKHLGVKAIKYVTKLFNLSVNQADIPAIWKLAHIIPLLKPGKDADKGLSYRPISLLCSLVKLLERLLLPSVVEALPKGPNQHGFAPLHSTSTAVYPIVNRIATAFNEVKPASRVATVAVDISKAFDSVDIDMLLSKIADSNLHPNLIRWLGTYLRGRKAVTLYEGKMSTQRTVHLGVPQGAVLSPALFSFFVSTIPSSAEVSCMFADDNTMSESGTVVEIERKLQQDVDELVEWCEANNLKIEPSKSSVCLYTPWTSNRERNPEISINGVQLNVESQLKILGIITSRHGSFSPHIDSMIKRSRERLKILSALAGSSWGCQKEVILMTFKALILPLFNYGCAVWFPMSSPSKIEELQRVQNSALRIATGCHMKADIHHLHDECKIMLVKDHLELLCSQFLASALRPCHPNHGVVRSLPTRRTRNQPTADFTPKNTLYSLFRDKIQPFLVNDIIPELNYKTVIKTLHTESVRVSLAAMRPNVLLGTRPPEISDAEKELPRAARTTLSQLRSSYSIKLNSYRFSIGLSQDMLCPDCLINDHTSTHLFNCPAFPTNLSVADLWSKPKEVVEFLVSRPAFDDLLPANPPAPPPPPQPPP